MSSPAGSQGNDHLFDYILVGGGLQNSLIAMALLVRRPEVRLALVERRGVLGGNHIWCFHSDDVSERAGTFVDPLIAHRWPGYEIRFPGLGRVLDTPYAAVTCERLHRVVTERLSERPGCSLFLHCEVKDLAGREVFLADGRQLRGRAVIDARGPRASYPAGTTGYQKFLGCEFILAAGHELARPVIMDATVEQGEDGYRFFYVLPLARDRVLIEETHFSDTPSLANDQLRHNVTGYAEQMGLRVSGIAREETGILPMPWQGQVELPAPDGPMVAGYRGGWFHPATGYSFPVAVRLADHVSSTTPDELIGAGFLELVAEQNRQASYCYKLNKMMFGWFPPDQRYNVFKRFYRLPEATIRRFYALALTRGDRLRILMGLPPRGLSIRKALSSPLAPAQRGTR
ncbi:MAG: lycopene beta-cyclase CrtY [Proteobacteria bacterium]|nr:lycopene beta-cyclase CrtY [Pseudomonadota bacterium]